jgi:hypothetical protein
MKVFVLLIVAFVLALQLTASNADENDNDDGDDNNNNNDDGNDGFLTYDTCTDGVVQVTNIKILCDSPYSYSYGNGAHRNSPLCDYGDQATISVFFDVYTSLGSGDSIYIDMAVNAVTSSTQLLWEQKAVELSTLVGHSCTEAGSYGFATTGTFNSNYNDQSEFYPDAVISFSTEADQGSDLGGVNVECELGSFYDGSNSWVTTSNSSKGTRAGNVLKNLFIFGAVFGVIGAVGFKIRDKYADNIEYQGAVEKMNGYYNNMGWGETEVDAELPDTSECDADSESTKSMHA